MPHDLLPSGSNLLYMKVGVHAKESLEDILVRKRAEIEQVGMSLWGYGGNTCHPTSMVQPFAEAARGPINLCMIRMKSKHAADPIRAEEFSADGINWEEIPDPINVLGSRYALAIRSLDEVEKYVDLSKTSVAVGPSRGKAGSSYIQHRVDKACLTVSDTGTAPPQEIKIDLMAELMKPYAVFVR